MDRYGGLTLFISDGRLEIDNNIFENLNRSIALLRKNRLFAASEDGARAWMLFASLAGCCQLNSINPAAYFHWLLEKVENGYPISKYADLLPWNSPVERHQEHLI